MIIYVIHVTTDVFIRPVKGKVTLCQGIISGVFFCVKITGLATEEYD